MPEDTKNQRAAEKADHSLNAACVARHLHPRGSGDARICARRTIAAVTMRRALDQASHDLNVGRYLPDMVEEGVQQKHCREPASPRCGTLPPGSTIGQKCRMTPDCYRRI